MFCFIFQFENVENIVIILDIKLYSNFFVFNIYCNVRYCVLEWQKKEILLVVVLKNLVQSGELDSDEEEEFREFLIKLLKVSYRILFICIVYQWFGYYICLYIFEIFCFF